MSTEAIAKRAKGLFGHLTLRMVLIILTVLMLLSIYISGPSADHPAASKGVRDDPLAGVISNARQPDALLSQPCQPCQPAQPCAPCNPCPAQAPPQDTNSQIQELQSALKSCANKSKPNYYIQKDMPFVIFPTAVENINNASQHWDAEEWDNKHLCPRGHWNDDVTVWQPIPECEAEQKPLSKRWIIIAGDSNSRKNFHAMATKLGLIGSNAAETPWTGAERWDPVSGFRLSFRFVPYNELRSDGYNCATMLLNEPQHAFMYGKTTPFVYHLPDNVVTNDEQPDVLLWGTGGWEFGATKLHWDDYWSRMFVWRIMEVLDRVRWNRPAKEFVWVTTTERHPNKAGPDLFDFAEMDHVASWFNAMATKLTTDAGHQVVDLHNISKGTKRYFTDHIHYGGRVRTEVVDYLCARFAF